ncbi:hypothetical protein CYLTODRAFT_326798, partial [Cylindrobasidium torrendii FP15055 ss-10]
MGWSLRKSTRAAQKTPADWEEQCTRTFFRIAHTIKEEDIVEAMMLNTDQTFMPYSHGCGMTYELEGSHQVTTIGQDEKRAFTAVVTVAANREMLPIQAVYGGSDATRSLPKAKSAYHSEATKAGMKFTLSGNDKHWSTHQTMHELVDDIIAPYFARKRRELGLEPNRKAIWLIDVWSVHRSEEFRTWMKTHHPNIKVFYVPAGCT